MFTIGDGIVVVSVCSFLGFLGYNKIVSGDLCIAIFLITLWVFILKR